MDILLWGRLVLEALLSPAVVAEGIVAVISVVVGAGLSWLLYIRGVFWNWATSDAIFLYKALLRIKFVLVQLETQHSGPEQSLLVGVMKKDAQDAGIYLRQIEGLSEQKSRTIETALSSVEQLRSSVAPPERQRAMLLVEEALVIVKKMARR